MSTRRDMALVDAMTEDLIAGVDSGASLRLWQDLQDTLRTYRTAEAAHDHVRAQTALARFIDMVETGASQAEAFEEIAQLLERRRKLSDSEQRRLERMGRLVDLQDVVGVITAFCIAIRDAVQGRVPPEAARAILSDVNNAATRALGSHHTPDGA